jgi:cytochrome c2
MLDPAKKEDRAKILKKTRLQAMALAPNLSRGLKIIEEVGCFGCHPIEGYQHKPKPAPDLTRAVGKFKDHAGWMVGWIMNPKDFRPNTRMPRFWPEHAAPNEYPYPIDVEARKKKQVEEATAMTAFLLATSSASKTYTYELEPLPAGGDAQKGKELVGTLGCAGCHVVPVEGSVVDHKNRATHFDYGPDLSNVGAKTSEQWIYNWVRDPRRYAPGTRMPNLRLSRQEAAHVARFLAGQKGKPDAKKVDQAAPNLGDKDLVAAGGALVKKYGCFGCHLVEGYEETPGIGAELTEFGIKTTERLDFGDYIPDHNFQTWENWTYNKLQHPRVYTYERVETLMPQFDLTEEEIRGILVVLKGMRGDTKETVVLAKKLSREEEVREHGRELIRQYNCMGCHSVDGWVGDLRQLSQYSGENQKYGPPILEGQGARAQPDWLFGFLKQPFTLRPLPKVRMPTFGFTDGEATQVVAMFAAIDRVPYPFIDYQSVAPKSDDEERIGRALFEFTGCQKCHVVGDIAPGEALPEGVVAPNLVMTKQRLRAEWVSRWLADPNALQPGTAMPAFWASQSQLDVALKTNATAQALLAGVDRKLIEEIIKSREAQIQAVRNYLFVLASPGPQAGPAPRETRTALNK